MKSFSQDLFKNTRYYLYFKGESLPWGMRNRTEEENRQEFGEGEWEGRWGRGTGGKTRKGNGEEMGELEKIALSEEKESFKFANYTISLSLYLF